MGGHRWGMCMVPVGLRARKLFHHPPVFPSGIHERDNRRMPALDQPVLGQRDRVVPYSPIGMGGSSPSLVPPVSGPWRPRRGDAACRVE